MFPGCCGSWNRLLAAALSRGFGRSEKGFAGFRIILIIVFDQAARLGKRHGANLFLGIFQGSRRHLRSEGGRSCSGRKAWPWRPLALNLTLGRKHFRGWGWSGRAFEEISARAQV